MSYEIVYGKQFIKTKKYIIPVILTGSNNCTMYYGGREIRDRSWTPLANLVGLTEQELKNKINTWLGGQYQQHFMQNGKWVDDKGLVNFIKNATRKAKTIEEIKTEFGYSTKCSLSVWNNGNNTLELKTCISTNEEFENWLEQAITRVKNKKEEEQIYYDISWDTIKALKPLHKEDINGQVLVKYETYRKQKYYASEKSESGNWQYTPRKEKAHIFDSVQQAKEEMKNERVYYQFVKYKKPKTLAEKPYVIRYYGNYGKCFMKKHTKSTLHNTRDITQVQQRFFTIEQAQSFIDAKLKYFDIRDIEIIDGRNATNL